MSQHESVFTYGAPALKFGSGSSAEIGFDLTTYGARRVLLSQHQPAAGPADAPPPGP